jgi:predicted GNAT family acetyltransferase
MTPEEQRLLSTLSVYVEALASCVATDVLNHAIETVNTKRAALAQARSEVASRAQVAPDAPVAPIAHTEVTPISRKRGKRGKR